MHPYANRSGGYVLLDALEPRRLLSFTPGPEMTVTGAAGGAGFDVAVAADGSYIVATSVARGEVHRVTAFRYAASGAPIGDPITLYSYIPPSATRTANIAASIDADGDAVVAYGVYDDVVNAGMYFNRISRTGQVSRTVKVTNIDNAPIVSMDAGGGFFLAWRVAGEDYYVARAFDAAGVPRASQFDVVSGPGIGFVGSMDLVARPDGTGAVFAAERTYDSDSGHVQDRIAYGRTSTSAVVGTVEEFNEPFNMSQPAVAVHNDGSFAIGYRRIDQANTALRTVHVRRFSADSAEVGGPVQLGGSLPSDGNGTHSVALDDAPGGGFVASFVQTVGTTDTIYAASFDAAAAVDESGYVWPASDAAAANTWGDVRFVPRIGADAQGSAVVGYVKRSSPEVRHRRLAGDNAIAELRGAELFVDGTEGNDHIIVERVRERLWVNVNGIVEGYNASAVRFLSISGLGGDDDVVNASAIPSTISGGDGSDTVWGGTGSDELRGFGGNDSLRGGDGDDVLLGGNGDDTLHGGDGTDTLTGGNGQDALIFGEVLDRPLRGFTLDGNVLTFTGTDANDSVTVWRSGLGVIVWVDGVTGAFPLDDVHRVEMRGNGGDDALTLDFVFPLPGIIDGGAGDDTLVGGGSSDTLLGGDGDDEHYGRRGEDHIDGAAGHDLMDGGSADDTLDYSSRSNPIELTTRWAGEVGERDVTVDFERILGGAGDDLIGAGRSIFGGNGDDTLIGSDQADQLFGEAGNDDLDGGGDADYLEGGAGDDTLRSTDGDLPFNGVDSLFGLAGNDTFLTDDGAADTIRGGAGDDSAETDDEDDVLAVEAVL